MTTEERVLELQEQRCDIVFDTGVITGIRIAAQLLIEREHDIAAGLVLGITTRPTRAEIMPLSIIPQQEKQDGNEAGTSAGDPPDAPAG